MRAAWTSRSVARVRRLARRTVAWLALRALVVALLAPLACASMLPSLARLAGGPPAHVCHCSVGGAHVDCRVCNPRVDRLPEGERAITGRCGDDQLPASGRLPFVVAAAAAAVVVAPSAPIFGERPLLSAPDDITHSPPRPPPRSST